MYFPFRVVFSGMGRFATLDDRCSEPTSMVPITFIPNRAAKRAVFYGKHWSFWCTAGPSRKKDAPGNLLRL